MDGYVIEDPTSTKFKLIHHNFLSTGNFLELGQLGSHSDFS
jgi:hypothetical protein